MMRNLTTIEIRKEDIKFSAAHFTIFSATERERLHGHNFAVSVEVTAAVGPNGMCFGYKEIKDSIRALCRELDEYVILPDASPFLEVEEDGEYYVARFGAERMYFLKSDTRLLPIRNSTVEEYSRYLLGRLVNDSHSFVSDNDINSIVLKVATGPGQWGSTTWSSP